MKTISRTPQFTVWMLSFLVLLLSAKSSMSAPGANEAPMQSTSQSLAMIRELQATRAHPSLGSDGEVFGRLIGKWNVEYSFISKDGKVTHETGEYLAGWVTNGRAIQDVWVVNPSKTRKDREIYTTLFYSNTKSKTWYASWFDPEHGFVARFTGSVEGNNRIVILTHDFGGNDDRWSFNEIGHNSFVFHVEESTDGGKTWRLAEEDRMTRSAADRPSV